MSKVKELLDSEKKWTQKTWARNKHDVATHPGDVEACSFCLGGALQVCYKYTNDNRQAIQKILQAIFELFPERFTGGIAFFNDDPRTTFEDVVKVIEKAGV